MPGISVWGPPTWTMLHILAEKVNETDYPRLSAQLFGMVKRICAVLPCPECSEHATTFLNTIKQTFQPKKILLICCICFIIE